MIRLLGWFLLVFAEYAVLIALGVAALALGALLGYWAVGAML